MLHPARDPFATQYFYSARERVTESSKLLACRGNNHPMAESVRTFTKQENKDSEDVHARKGTELEI